MINTLSKVPKTSRFKVRAVRAGSVKRDTGGTANLVPAFVHRALIEKSSLRLVERNGQTPSRQPIGEELKTLPTSSPIAPRVLS